MRNLSQITQLAKHVAQCSREIEQLADQLPGAGRTEHEQLAELTALEGERKRKRADMQGLVVRARVAHDRALEQLEQLGNGALATVGEEEADARGGGGGGDGGDAMEEGVGTPSRLTDPRLGLPGWRVEVRPGVSGVDATLREERGEIPNGHPMPALGKL